MDNFLHKLGQRKFLQIYFVKKLRGRGRGREKVFTNNKWRIGKVKNQEKKIKIKIFTSQGLAYTNTEWTRGKQSKSPSDVNVRLHLNTRLEHKYNAFPHLQKPFLPQILKPMGMAKNILKQKIFKIKVVS